MLGPPAVLALGVLGPDCLVLGKEDPELSLNLSSFSPADKSSQNRSENRKSSAPVGLDRPSEAPWPEIFLSEWPLSAPNNW